MNEQYWTIKTKKSALNEDNDGTTTMDINLVHSWSLMWSHSYSQ